MLRPFLDNTEITTNIWVIINWTPREGGEFKKKPSEIHVAHFILFGFGFDSLPVHFSIQFKVLAFIFKALNELMPGQQKTASFQNELLPLQTIKTVLQASYYFPEHSSWMRNTIPPPLKVSWKFPFPRGMESSFKFLIKAKIFTFYQE